MGRRRLLRILLNAATAVSAVLCVVIAVLWARSYRRYDRVEYYVPHRVFAIQSLGGQAAVTTTGSSLPTPWDGQGLVAQSTTRNRIKHLTASASGFDWDIAPNGIWGNGYTSGLAAPNWFITLTLGVMPAARALRVARRRSRPVAGRCAACNYDPRATPDRCPECGTLPTPAIRLDV